MTTAERRRLLERRNGLANWDLWGPYLSERAWGTVREDYSPAGNAWDDFPHDHARSRTYRWNEDGLAGVSDRGQFVCLALALWNGKDAILKERLFGLTGPQGNHGEDVKEYYFYLDSTPTHSYMEMRYKYPQAAFPYRDLVAENAARGYGDFEYELLDTGAFAEDRYFDVTVRYAKAAADDLLMEVHVHNRGPEAARCIVLPTLWFRNTWRWGYPEGPMFDTPHKPNLRQSGPGQVVVEHPALDQYHWYVENGATLLFTENETNEATVFNQPNRQPYVKDAFHRYVVHGDHSAVNPERTGTKTAALYDLDVPAGGVQTVRVRLCARELTHPFGDFATVLTERQRDADEFYAAVHPAALTEDERRVQRQALAGLLWSKQMYYYDVQQWLTGDPAFPPPPANRKHIRNGDWGHLNNWDIISMPDKWEYPWYAGWDLAFHCIPLALVDPDFAKDQLLLLTREWYMHPNGQLPAYEWRFDDVNPPVHAWGAWEVYQLDAAHTGQPDSDFLERIFHKLLLNFTWWVNRKDADGNNVFQGGFLGLDNISIFDRSSPLPTGGHLDQSDGTSWMGFYSLQMLQIALELAKDNPVYQDTATKFFEHFLRIARAMTEFGHGGTGLWDEEDGFFYDVLHLHNGDSRPLKVRSLVGLMPLIATIVLEPALATTLPDFYRRMRWFLKHEPDFGAHIAMRDLPGPGERYLASVVTKDRLVRVLGYLLDENEFLSPYGIRSVSKYHEDNPYTYHVGGAWFELSYQPAESLTGLFGGNSNWRGPVWFPINYLIIESLRTLHTYHGGGLRVECPTGSGNKLTLSEVADELATRLTRLFLRDDSGQRPVFGGDPTFQTDPHWRDHLLFYEYFHGDNGAGLGASHQTGWTGLVAALLQQLGAKR